VTDAGFSWNLIDDVRQMWSMPFMVNAYRAGTVVAVLAAAVGWFMVLRRQTFAGHALSLVGFPGAAAAVWLGLGAGTGYLAGCLAAAVVFATVGGAGRGYREESALIGTVQAFALAAGALFIALSGRFLSGTTALLFGGFLGITRRQVSILVVVAAAALVALAAIGRPLLFASVDVDVARAHGVPTGLLDVGFLVLLGAAVAEVSQITGALLVFALLVLPPATAQLVTTRPARSLALAVLSGLASVWLALLAGYYTPYPIGFWLTTVAFAMYVLTAAGTALTRRRRGVRLAGATA
jgi:zinc/manganese transport system permease protein